METERKRGREKERENAQTNKYLPFDWDFFVLSKASILIYAKKHLGLIMPL